jgi:hypothetical protein
MLLLFVALSSHPAPEDVIALPPTFKDVKFAIPPVTLEHNISPSTWRLSLISTFAPVDSI